MGTENIPGILSFSSRGHVMNSVPYNTQGMLLAV